MPIIQSAKKKMRQDKKRTEHNRQKEVALKGLLKNVRRTPSVDLINQAASALDKASKTHLIHPNKAARLKSRLAKKLATTTSK